MRALGRRIVRWLIRRSGFARRWFRLPSEDYFRPDLNRRILAKIRAQVFGNATLSTVSRQVSPRELLQRSYAQHLCQLELMGDPRVRWIQNALAGVLLVPLTLWWVARYFLGRITHATADRADRVVFQYQPHVRDLVEGLRPADSTVYLTTRSVELSPLDLRFALRLFSAFPACWLDFLFFLKALFGIGYYSFAARRYMPSEILDFHEHSAAVSLQTAYCRARAIRHINLMHGDRAFVVEYGFATFDEFHVWGDYYEDLFLSLCCPSDQFKISGNLLHQRLFQELALKPAATNRRPCLLVFYETLMTPTGPYLNLLERLLAEVPDKWRVVMRCRSDRTHEQSSGEQFVQALNQRLASQGRPLAEVESELQKSIRDSIDAADAVVGIYSTALLDAWVAGRKVIQLRSKRDSFYIPQAPYADSANLITYDEDVVLGNFLARQFQFGQKEVLLLNHVSYQPGLIPGRDQAPRRSAPDAPVAARPEGSFGA